MLRAAGRDDLEHRYAAFRGLNLTWETLEGIVKHNGPLIDDEASAPALRLEGAAACHPRVAKIEDLELGTYCSLEGQIASVADDIAYNNHDIDDGFRAGYIAMGTQEVPMAGRARAVRARYSDIPDATLVYKDAAHDRGHGGGCAGESRARIEAASPRSISSQRAGVERAALFFPADGRRYRHAAKFPAKGRSTSIRPLPGKWLARKRYCTSFTSISPRTRRR